MDDGGANFHRGEEWEVVRYAQQCDAESAKQSLGVSIELWNEGKTRLYFDLHNPGSLADGQKRELTISIMNSENIIQSFEVLSQPGLPDGHLTLSTYISDDLKSKIIGSPLVEFRYRGRLVKGADFSKFVTTSRFLSQCVDSIYRIDPFID